MLKRELDDYERYDVHKKITKELFGDSEEYIKTKIFDSSFTPHVLCSNTFPYKTPYKHKVLFINPKYEKFYPLERIKREIVPNYIKMWINDPSTKSVHTIKHYQIYI
jgi:UDP-N-acetylglucosamine pyrophosphorylase